MKNLVFRVSIPAIALVSCLSLAGCPSDCGGGGGQDSGGGVDGGGGQDAGGRDSASDGSADSGSNPAYWTVQFGTAAVDYATSVGKDLDDNILVAGFTYGSMPGNTNAGGCEFFVAKYDTGGVQHWVRQLGRVVEQSIGVAADSLGNVYVAGTSAMDVTFDGEPSAGSSDIFLVKYDPSGVKQWTRQFGTEDGDEATSVTVDNNDFIYIAGSTLGALDGTPRFGENAFVVKFDSGGARLWNQMFGSQDWDEPWSIATDSGGTISVAGRAPGSMPGFTNAGGDDLFVVQYDASGTIAWTSQLGTASDDQALGVTMLNGDAYAVGLTYGGLDGNTNAGQSDFFLTKFNASGVKQWTRQMGTAQFDEALGVTTYYSGDIYVVGYVQDGFDGSTYAGGNDAFVVKYNFAGNKQWSRQFGTSNADVAVGAVVDFTANVYVAGRTQGGLDGHTNAGSVDVFIVKYNGLGQKQ